MSCASWSTCRMGSAHTTVDEWLSIDNNSVEEHRSSGGSAGSLPYCTVGGLEFRSLVGTEKTRDSGFHVQCRHCYDKAEISQLYNTGNDGRPPTFYILRHRVPYPAYAHLLA